MERRLLLSRVMMITRVNGRESQLVLIDEERYVRFDVYNYYGRLCARL
jgi:hypothetical protein